MDENSGAAVVVVDVVDVVVVDVVVVDALDSAGLVELAWVGEELAEVTAEVAEHAVNVTATRLAAQIRACLTGPATPRE